MSSIFGIARSGLEVASLRLATSAHNVANTQTDGFVPDRVEAEELPDGGVAGTVRKESGSDVEAQVGRVIVGLSGTDLVQETVNQILAAASFRANLATLRTADETLDSLVSIKS